MIPRVGHAPDANRQYRLRPGAYAILPQRHGFLLTMQVADQVDIQLPGGGIDAGESAVQALHREVLEETGWRIAQPKRLGAFRRFVYMPEYDLWAEKLCHVYVARPVYQIAAPSEPDHLTITLRANEAIEALGNDGDRRLLSAYVSRLSG